MTSRLELAEYLRSLPRKRMSAGAVLTDARGHWLMVKPTYRAGWSIPGGVVEADESPRRACQREVFEETGLAIEPHPLLLVDYAPSQGDLVEGVHFVFGADRCEAEVEIRLADDELSAWRFVPPKTAIQLAEPGLSRRLAALVEEGLPRPVYLEQGSAR
ncbi:MAG: NUDIX hydrolase [Pseudomonadota bacterium]|nr:NUDIX hydrolase [Pseudomonadota bacterium]